MADMPSTTKTEVHWSKVGTIPAGARLVIVVNPTTVTGGQVIFDKTVPVGKTFDGRVGVDGQLK